jgi:DNA (cytosine-5)-methyltransferase 1
MVLAMECFEICAGAGGQALGLEQAGFAHAALVENDPAACMTLKLNRPNWLVLEADVRNVSALHLKGIALVSGGVPCPPFSVAGKQLGHTDERDLFPEALRFVDEARPDAVMLENVRGLLDSIFDEYRARIIRDLRALGYEADWRLLNASDYGVPQLRPRVVFVALRRPIARYFSWPQQIPTPPASVGEVLHDLMTANGWKLADRWRDQACDIAPTIVGGSKKHGGPDLGPPRAKRAWSSIGVDGLGIADRAPEANFVGRPRLTARMVARLQGFPDTWHFYGKKTAAYRQIGNAFPPPVAKAVGTEVARALERAARCKVRRA